MLGWMWKGLTGLLGVGSEEIDSPQGVEMEVLGTVKGTVSRGPSREEISADKIKELTGSSNLEDIKKILQGLAALEESEAARLLGSLKEKLGGEGMEKFSPLTRVLDSYLRKTDPKETGNFVQALVDETTWGLVTEFMQINSGDEDYLKNLVAFTKRIKDKLDADDLPDNAGLIYGSLLDQTQVKIREIISEKINTLNDSSDLNDIKSILEGIAALEEDKAVELLGSLKEKLGGEGMEKFVPLANLFETFLKNHDRKKCDEFIENIIMEDCWRDLTALVDEFAKIDKISKSLDQLLPRLDALPTDANLQSIQAHLEMMGFNRVVHDVEELLGAGRERLESIIRGSVLHKYADQVAVKTLNGICDELNSKLSELRTSGSVDKLRSNLVDLQDGIEKYRSSLTYFWDLFVNAVTLGNYGQRARDVVTDQAAINSLLGVLDSKSKGMQSVPQEGTQKTTVNVDEHGGTISSLQKRYGSWTKPKGEVSEDEERPVPG